MFLPDAWGDPLGRDRRVTTQLWQTARACVSFFHLAIWSCGSEAPEWWSSCPRFSCFCSSSISSDSAPRYWSFSCAQCWLCLCSAVPCGFALLFCVSIPWLGACAAYFPVFILLRVSSSVVSPLCSSAILEALSFSSQFLCCFFKDRLLLSHASLHLFLLSPALPSGLSLHRLGFADILAGSLRHSAAAFSCSKLV